MNEQIFITKEGLENAKKELEDRLVKRNEILVRVDTARQHGDLKENGEYQVAREDQRANERKIEELDYLIKFAQIVETPSGKSNLVGIGNTVKIKLPNGDKKEFRIVGHAESNPAQGLISNESPIGRALLGRQKGEKVEVTLPKGAVFYLIEDIS